MDLQTDRLSVHWNIINFSNILVVFGGSICTFCDLCFVFLREPNEEQ